MVAVSIDSDIREQAATICAIAASTPDLHDSYSLVCEEADIALGDAFELALAAWSKAYRYETGGPRDAEAEALIRTGVVAMSRDSEIREQAAMICAIAASGGVGSRFGGRSPFYATISAALGCGDDALALALAAYTRAMERLGHVWTREVDAEAEALLRTGWSP